MAPPANDNFASATALSATVPGALTGQTTFDATKEVGEQTAITTLEQSVWYKFTPTADGVYRFDLTNITYSGITSPGDGQVHIRLGKAAANSLANFTAANKFDDDSYRTDSDWLTNFYDGATRVQAPLVSGTTYWIRVAASEVSGVTNQGVVDFDIEWDVVPPPSNDDFADATVLSTTLPGTLTGETTYGATDEPTEVIQWGDNQQSVWYTFTPTTTGRYRFKLDNFVEHNSGSDFRLMLRLYSGSTLAGLTTIYQFLKQTGDGLHDEASVSAVLTSGTTYHIQVLSPIFTPEPPNHHTADFDLHWDQVTVGTAPANDDIADAIDLGTDPSTPQSGSTIDATSEAWETLVGWTEASVWYRFDSSFTGDMTINVTRTGSNPGWYPYFELYKIINDPPASFDDLEYVQYAPPIYDPIFEATGRPDFPVEALQKYVIFISPYYYNGETDDFELTFVAAPPGPANDDLANFITVNDGFQSHAGKIEGTTVDASFQSGEDAHGGYGPTRSVWYRYFPPWQGGDFKIWVESADDCVLSVYTADFPSSPQFGQLHSQAEDDDSGTGNNPEVLLTDVSGSTTLFIAVDSKVETTFTLKWQRQSTGTPPANDDFANAEVHTQGFTAVGTTVGGTGEPDEMFLSEYEGVAATDGVWYKYTPSFTGTAQIRGVCLTQNEDAYIFVHAFTGTSLDDLTIVTNGDNPAGEFYFGDTVDQGTPYLFDVVSGTDYYIRVATWSGGSEDFEIYVDTQEVYLNLTPSGTEEVHGTLIDSATVYLDLRASGTETYHVSNVIDAATVLLKIKPGAIFEAQGQETVDSATVLLDLSVLGGECFSRFHFVGEGEADTRWAVASVLTRWSSDPETRWATQVESQPGCH